MNPLIITNIFDMDDKYLWIEAINEELKSLKDMKVYILVNNIPKNSNVGLLSLGSQV